jgi:intein-encoded DNA endonuclease-like protein
MLETSVKTCSKCHEEKEVAAFSYKSKAKGIRHGVCRSCQKKVAATWYRSNKQTHLKKVRCNTERHKERACAYLGEVLRSSACVDCGEDDPLVLEFDHIEDKDTTISEMRRTGYSVSRIKKELEKCQIRCANCHRRGHFLESGNWRTELLT